MINYTVVIFYIAGLDNTAFVLIISAKVIICVDLTNLKFDTPNIEVIGAE